MLGQAKARIQPMEYRAMVADALAGAIFSEVPEVQVKELAGPDREELQLRVRELEDELEQMERKFQEQLHAVQKEAYEAGGKSQQSMHASSLAMAAGHFAEAMEEFRHGRDSYLAEVEREVVRLALALAERVLHREAQMDPLLLSGAVRVALGQLAETTEVKLRVPIDEQEMWEEMLRLMPNLPLRPELVGDERMKAGECTIETHLGTVDIGVRAQLAEVERGFFDLLEHRGQRNGNLQPVDR